jgi:thiol-disulfide isomerase/thioredoxin
MKKMKKILLPFLMLLFGLLACKTLIPDAATPVAVATFPIEATAFAAGEDFTLVRIYPKDGKRDVQLAAQAKKAQALNRALFLEFDATWCPPCQAITDSLAAKNELTLKAYSGIYLVHADVDEWGWDNSAAGFPAVSAIPVFFKLDEDGGPTDAVIDGGAWKADIPENFAPVLEKFFHP